MDAAGAGRPTRGVSHSGEGQTEMQQGGPVPFARMVRDLPPGALFVFLGDSITEQNLYTLYFELYMRSRWQDKRFRFVNVGWGGHRAADGLGRLQRDVLGRDPDVVTVCFGMNDGQYRAPDRGVLRAYRRDLDALVRRVREGSRAAVAVLSPPPADTDAAPALGLCRYNDTLERLTAAAEEVASAHGCTFVDVFHPVLQVQRLAKSIRPDFCFTPDGVHPDPVGHLVIAYHLLAGLGLVVPAASATIDAAAGQALNAETCTIADLVSDSRSVRCTLLAEAPPYPLPPEAAAAEGLVPWTRELGHNRVSVVGLARGRYGVYSGPDPLGNFNAEELRRGVDVRVRAAVRVRWEAAFNLARERFADHLTAWRRLDPVIGGTDSGGTPEIMEAYRALGAAQEEALRALLRPLPLPLEVVPEVALRFARWEVAGPYPLGERDGFAAEFPPERGEQAPWADAAAHRPEEGFIDFVRLFGPVTQAVAYARCYVHVPTEAILRLRVGSDDGWKLFVQGRFAGGRDVYRGAAPDQDRIEVGLAPGWNELLFRVNNGAGDWHLYCAGAVTGVDGAEGQVRVVARPPAG